MYHMLRRQRPSKEPGDTWANTRSNGASRQPGALTEFRKFPSNRVWFLVTPAPRTSDLSPGETHQGRRKNCVSSKTRYLAARGSHQRCSGFAVNPPYPPFSPSLVKVKACSASSGAESIAFFSASDRKNKKKNATRYPSQPTP